MNGLIFQYLKSSQILEWISISNTRTAISKLVLPTYHENQAKGLWSYKLPLEMMTAALLVMSLWYYCLHSVKVGVYCQFDWLLWSASFDRA